MKLGDLEFKPEDFAEVGMADPRGREIFTNYPPSEFQCKQIADAANALLETRLGKARVIRLMDDRPICVHQILRLDEYTTYSLARLVCIEKVD